VSFNIGQLRKKNYVDTGATWMKTAGTKENWQFCTVPVQPLSGVTYNNRMFIWTS